LFVVVENVRDCKGQNVVDSHSLTLFSTDSMSQHTLMSTQERKMQAAAICREIHATDGTTIDLLLTCVYVV